MAKPRKSLAIEKRREDLLPVISLSPIIHMEPMVNEQLLSAYLGAYFPDLQTSTSHRWPSIISNIMGLPQKGALLQHTCAALPRIYFGRVKLDTALFHDGLNRFNHAIRLFSKSISRNSYTEDVVHAAVIFQEIKVGKFF